MAVLQDSPSMSATARAIRRRELNPAMLTGFHIGETAKPSCLRF